VVDDVDEAVPESQFWDVRGGVDCLIIERCEPGSHDSLVIAPCCSQSAGVGKIDRIQLGDGISASGSQVLAPTYLGVEHVDQNALEAALLAEWWLSDPLLIRESL